MGLTHSSVGRGALERGTDKRMHDDAKLVVALAGNPNVGKSTIFNSLTGMDQHTGNWPGKTVTSASGRIRHARHEYMLVDLPGTYSLAARSPEEEVARDFLCFGSADAVIVVCDATCLERNLNLVLQTLEMTSNVIVCVNLCDEAKRKGIHIDIDVLSNRLGVPVIGTVGHSKKSLKRLTDALDELTGGKKPLSPYLPSYPDVLERELEHISGTASESSNDTVSRGLALQLIRGEKLALDAEATNVVREASVSRKRLSEQGIGESELADMTVGALAKASHDICDACVSHEGKNTFTLDRRLDRIFTSKLFGYPIMLLFFAFIFWLTVTGANYPSELLSRALFSLEGPLLRFFTFIRLPSWLCLMLTQGAYRVLAWVVSVMLPPMAIFFPLFTLLEDIGYLPRIAYVLDKPFKTCGGCGKQALTTCMGFGCNAAGVVGTRIIDSPRERLLAILTNSFVPCNGRFPLYITLTAVFFTVGFGTLAGSLISALVLTSVILIGVLGTLVATRLLSRTLLRGSAASFVLELPPYRRPRVLQIVIRSIFDRTLFVLARSAAVAAPAGALIWVLASVELGDGSLLEHISELLEPLGRLMGLDGAILTGFILGLPANEIVLPIIMMIYTASRTLTESVGIASVGDLLISNGWTYLTALNVMLFSLMHWPCSTTLMTVKRETGSLGYTLLAAILPTVFGIIICMLTNMIFGM